jgi:osmotically-inducible protein OsmY
MTPDRKLAADVLAAVAGDPQTATAAIAVVTQQGAVTLTGRVESCRQARAAEAVCARVRGVLSVSAALEVHPPAHGQRSDPEILAEARQRLVSDAGVPAGCVSVGVLRGGLTLRGTVTHPFQREAAGQAVLPLWGVTRIDNCITVKATRHELSGGDAQGRVPEPRLSASGRVDVTAVRPGPAMALGIALRPRGSVQASNSPRPGSGPALVARNIRID